MRADLLVTNINELATPTGTGMSRGHAMDAVDVIEDAAMAITGDRIVWVGEREQWQGTAAAEIDALGCAVIPALVDPHTHAVWRGDRLEDFEARSRGASYEEILARGGGIRSTINDTNCPDDGDIDEWLVGLADERVGLLISSGAATIEIKSGYGFSHEGEIRLLEAIRIVGEQSEATIIPTLLIHVPPLERAERGDYVQMVCNELIEETARRKLAGAVDVFIEREAFTVDEARIIFAAATAAGLRVKAHVDQFHVIGGLELAIEFNALSVDHLEASGPAQVAALAASDTVGVILPGASLQLGGNAAPGRALIDAGAAVAVATDLNPGSSPLFSVQLAMALAVRVNKLSACEALTASTANAAAALGLYDTGRLRAGQRADFIITDFPDWRDVVYTMGASPVARLFVGGKELTF
ncbi:MAG TPA: imidazolonepropionase [Gemmatimonadales bacterium]|jgi:imidazolonepropionase